MSKPAKSVANGTKEPAICVNNAQELDVTSVSLPNQPHEEVNQ